jgi:antitoxin VapB
MTYAKKTKVLTSDRSQAVRIPAAYPLSTPEVPVCRDPGRDPRSGDLISSETPRSWDEVFAALDSARIPDDFLSERTQ